MDFGTMEHRLRSRSQGYASAVDYFAEASLVFANCLLFNEPSEITDHCLQLREIFLHDMWYVRVFLPFCSSSMFSNVFMCHLYLNVVSAFCGGSSRVRYADAYWRAHGCARSAIGRRLTLLGCPLLPFLFFSMGNNNNIPSVPDTLWHAPTHIYTQTHPPLFLSLFPAGACWEGPSRREAGMRGQGAAGVGRKCWAVSGNGDGSETPCRVRMVSVI